MSHKQKIYHAYIEKFHAEHPRTQDVEKTLIHLKYQEGEDFFRTQMLSGMSPLMSSSKSNGGAYKVYLLSDGRILECNLLWDKNTDRVDQIRTDPNTSVFLFHGIVFSNFRDWSDYAVPMSFHMFWN